jgi:hypothetical protein
MRGIDGPRPVGALLPTVLPPRPTCQGTLERTRERVRAVRRGDYRPTPAEYAEDVLAMGLLLRELQQQLQQQRELLTRLSELNASALSLYTP